jgi:FkbM family methyltransferase
MRVRKTLAYAAFRLWPFDFGHVSLMNALNPPPVPAEAVTRRLRGFPLQMRFDPNSYIGRYLYFRGMYEEPVIKKLASLLEPGMVYVDVGANIGLHSLIAAWRVGPTGRVVAIEPQASVFEALCTNVAVNKLTNVDEIRSAVGNKEGSAVIYTVDPINSGQATLAVHSGESLFGQEQVAVSSLDDILSRMGLDQVDVLKVDVEGGELEVLEGSRRLFATRPPRFVMIECIDSHLQRFGHSSSDLVNWLTAFGYSVYGQSGSQWTQVVAATGLNVDLLAVRP